ncbi:unnamed protein product [Rotaria magnacalcarata]|uniref:Uncharacterized protein n=1 Tax=Rotaria magnacalcarata TaxID=392030 RepID=A0A8S3JKS0_9BILA|nr:unnamed protein product [Rotaria magnacalcarata]
MPNKNKSLQNSINVDPLQAASPSKVLPANTSVDNTSDVPQVTPSTSPPPIVVNDTRAQFLNSIADFNLAKLKQTKTIDRSAPKL